MTLILPSAPKNFYDPSLTTLKDSLLSVNGNTKGQFALITAVPANIEAAWSDVGVAGDTSLNINRGQYVVGHAAITAISGPLIGPEESVGETGYKLLINDITGIPIYIDGSGTTTALVIGAALIAGIDTYSLGTDFYVKYLPKINDLTVTDGGIIDIPAFEIIINYGESVV